MSQPPAGGYPPPYQPPNQPPAGGGAAGGFPPPNQPAPSGQPAGGGFPPAPGSYPSPDQSAPGSYPPPGGYGAPQQGGYEAPQQGGYSAPQQGNYPPPPGGYAQPGNYAPGSTGFSGPGGGSGGSRGNVSVDLSKVGIGDWIVIGLGVLLLIFSFFGWVSGYGDSIGGWHSWWFLIILIMLAITAIYATTILGIMKAGPIKPSYLFYGALGLVVLYIIALIHIFASYTYSASDACSGYGLDGTALAQCQALSSNASIGPGFGIWASIVLSIAFAYFIGLWAQKSDKLFVKLPGPAF